MNSLPSGEKSVFFEAVGRPIAAGMMTKVL
jgi:hypothetical protein